MGFALQRDRKGGRRLYNQHQEATLVVPPLHRAFPASVINRTSVLSAEFPRDRARREGVIIRHVTTSAGKARINTPGAAWGARGGRMGIRGIKRALKSWAWEGEGEGRDRRPIRVEYCNEHPRGKGYSRLPIACRLFGARQVASISSRW
jgi:hypothetical protein